MKQYTTPEQTAKLIKLGFEKPKGEVKAEQAGDNVWSNPAYSIGELIEMLPKSIKVNDLFFTLCIYPSSVYWAVEYNDISFGTQVMVFKGELIDALFAEIVILKEEGLI